MLQLFDPSQQLVAALILGSCTLGAAVVNAVAQLRVTRAARRKGLTSPRRPIKVRAWVVLGAALALALGWGATTGREAAAAAMPAGLPAIGAGGHADPGAKDTLVVASIALSRPVDDGALIRLLRRYELRPYALDFRLADRDESWRAVPVGAAPDEVVEGARSRAVRRAWEETCAYESVIAAAARGARPDASGRDSVAQRLIRTRAGAARRRAERLAEGEPAIHALRVVASRRSASAATTDSLVAGAEIVRYDPGWPIAAAPDPLDSSCEVIRVGEDRGEVEGSGSEG